MLAKKQMFSFGMPIDDILKMCTHDPIHVFWKNKLSVYWGCNDIQGQLIQHFTGHSNVIGKYSQEIAPGQNGLIIAANDHETIKESHCKCFIETMYQNCECLSLKSQLKNSANNVIGTLGLSFYFNEISLAKVAGILSKLNFAPQQLNPAILLPIDIGNKFLLTKREKECIRHMLRGMSAKEIGKTLNISNRTAECHIASIKHKMGCSTRSQLISKILDDIP